MWAVPSSNSFSRAAAFRSASRLLRVPALLNFRSPVRGSSHRRERGRLSPTFTTVTRSDLSIIGPFQERPGARHLLNSNASCRPSLLPVLPRIAAWLRTQIPRLSACWETILEPCVGFSALGGPTMNQPPRNSIVIGAPFVNTTVNSSLPGAGFRGLSRGCRLIGTQPLAFAARLPSVGLAWTRRAVCATPPCAPCRYCPARGAIQRFVDPAFVVYRVVPPEKARGGRRPRTRRSTATPGTLTVPICRRRPGPGRRRPAGPKPGPCRCGREIPRVARPRGSGLSPPCKRYACRARCAPVAVSARASRLSAARPPPRYPESRPRHRQSRFSAQVPAPAGRCRIAPDFATSNPPGRDGHRRPSALCCF